MRSRIRWSPSGGLGRLSDLPEDAQRKLTLIYQEVQRLEKFLNDMSTFTRGAPPQKTAGDLLALIREVAELMDSSFKERAVAFHLHAQGRIPPFAFDSGQIRQVLINLFKNALEAMPEGGHLTVSAAVQNDDLVLKITDTGHGIPAEQLQNLFTPFLTTKEGGTGLGLTICRGLIAQHQGEITIDNALDRGTTCTIRLPIVSA
jgi:signal transduction histidine kinase